MYNFHLNFSKKCHVMEDIMWDIIPLFMFIMDQETCITIIIMVLQHHNKFIYL